MFKVFRISFLLLILFIVSVSTWLSQSRSTDWNNSLWVKVYPINADGSDDASKYIQQLTLDDFQCIVNDFPAPFWPRMAMNWPCAANRLRSRTNVRPGTLTDSCWQESPICVACAMPRG